MLSASRRKVVSSQCVFDDGSGVHIVELYGLYNWFIYALTVCLTFTLITCYIRPFLCFIILLYASRSGSWVRFFVENAGNIPNQSRAPAVNPLRES